MSVIISTACKKGEQNFGSVIVRGVALHPIEAELERLVEAGLPGAFVSIEEADGSTRFYTAGFADLQTRQRMSPEQHYRVGSTTKTFTAVVLLQLIAEGKLTLSDTLRERLPDLGMPNADVMTIEHLLRMRSGLFDFEDDPSLQGDLPAHRVPTTLQRTLDLAARHPASFPPGERFSYCNTNFCILERVIERVTGHTLGEELNTRVLNPLGLTQTSYPDENDLTLPQPYIHGYERTQDGWEECSEVFFGRGDGALISTVGDLGRFFRALLLEKTLVPAELLTQMMRVIPDDPSAEDDYGMALMTYNVLCGSLWGHSGGGFGYGNMPYVQMESGRFAVIMINGSYGFHLPTEMSAKRPRITPEFRALVYC